MINLKALQVQVRHLESDLRERGPKDVKLEQEWRDWWVESGMPELGFPGKAFVAFCKSRYQRKPNP